MLYINIKAFEQLYKRTLKKVILKNSKDCEIKKVFIITYNLSALNLSQSTYINLELVIY